jgi:hypothetical protein
MNKYRKRLFFYTLNWGWLCDFGGALMCASFNRGTEKALLLFYLLLSLFYLLLWSPAQLLCEQACAQRLEIDQMEQRSHDVETILD